MYNGSFYSFKFRKDKKIRRSYKENEYLIRSFQSLKDCNTPIKSLHLLRFSCWLSKAKNRCLITANSKVFYTKFRLSRHSCRKAFVFGLMPGIKKAI